MNKREHTRLLKNLKNLDFKPATMNAQACFIAEPYKVIHYDWITTNSGIVEGSQWAAYYRIYDSHSKSMLFGDSVEKVGLYEGETYTTKEEAFAACQNHLERRQ